MQCDHLKPAGARLGINTPDQQLGWHVFRHTYRSILSGLYVPLEVQMALPRYGDYGMVMHYGEKSRKNVKELLTPTPGQSPE